MKARYMIMSLVLTAGLVLGMSAKAYANSPQLSVDAKSAVLLEPETGKILFEKNPDERLSPASVTKVMTMYLIYQALEQGRIKLDDVVTVSDHAARMGGSQIYLEPMEKQSVRDLLKAVVIASANDAAVALAEFIGGSEESFVDMMNQTAKDLELTNSQFKNACGLDSDGHYMSARDIAVLTKELINRHPEVFDYTGVWMDSITHHTARGSSEFGLTNTNKLIKWYNGATGLKTGSTSQALYCLSGTATRDNLSLVAVVLASPSPAVRFQEVMKMFDYGFANYKLVAGDEPGMVAGAVRVTKGQTDIIPVKIGTRVSAVVPKGAAGAVTSETRLDRAVSAPVSAGQKLGEVHYKYGDMELGCSDVVAANDIAKASFFDTLKMMHKHWFK
ncbi:MAG: D-alanyl-D-alanine carboxypeptidase [Clostridiales bacterium]|nr:D-alanyl-D-alanine carboxypeptidase [Clostridiales bacterium]